MGTSVLFKRTFVSVTVAAALTGLATMMGATGARARTVPTPHRGAAPQAGDTVYVDSDTGVYALNATTGAQVWHVLPKSGIYGSPAITGAVGQQVLITANLAGNLYALSPVTGATLWTQPGKAAYWSSPTVSQGTIYITSKNGQLRTFAPAGGG